MRTRRGFRLVQGRDVLSDVLAQPGATGGFFDVLAACAVVFAPGFGTMTVRAADDRKRERRPRLALLGFAAGGVVAPLRALGFQDRVDAVDLSHDAVPLFEEVATTWAGPLRIACAEASAWLRQSRHSFDVVIEDLTVPGPGGATKPAVSVEVLPALVLRRLAPGGVVVTNVLPVPGMTWGALLLRLAAPHSRALIVTLEEYENRILVAGSRLPSARAASRLLHAALHGIRSRQASRLSVREFT